MTALTVPADVEALLESLQDQTQICDEVGNILGYFTPWPIYEAEMYERAKALFDPVETERILAEQHGKGRPLAEFWKEMQAWEAATKS